MLDDLDKIGDRARSIKILEKHPMISRSSARISELRVKQIVTGAQMGKEGDKVPVVLDMTLQAAMMEKMTPGGSRSKKRKPVVLSPWYGCVLPEELGSTREMYPEDLNTEFIFSEDAVVGESAVKRDLAPTMALSMRSLSNRDLLQSSGIARGSSNLP